MLIQLPDEIALRYQSTADRLRVPLATLLARQLARFAEVPTDQRVLVLSGEPLAQIDQALGLGSTKSPDTLLAAVRAHASITIGGITIPFTPAQLSEIAHRAERQGKTPEAIVQDVVDQMAWRFFDDAVVAR